MYSEWLSLTETVRQPRIADNVLRTFPQDRAQEVVASVIKPLEDMSLGKNYNMLTTPEQVNWTMQVIGYGLTLPLSHLKLLGSCTDVYREWLTILGLHKGTVPLPISSQPDRYAQVIFDQMCVLFVPRENEKNLLEGHALICKNVIDTICSLIVVKKLKMSRDTWTTLLSFLLHVCDILLSPPPKTPSLGTALCDQLIHTLFAAWLRACREMFPGPTMWKTLQEFCASWRHQTSLINQWCQLMMSLTKKVTLVLYGSKHYKEISGSITDVEKRFRFLLDGMPKDAVVQCWFRMLHTLKNPMDLLYQELVTDTRGFKEVINEAELVAPGSSSGLLQSTKESLPKIFCSLMKGVTAQVFLFLGEKQEDHTSPTGKGGAQQRKDSTAQPTSPQSVSSTNESYYINLSAEPSSTIPFTSQEEMPSSDGIIGKPKGNTLLHVYGDWLFEAAIWTGQDSEGFPSRGGQLSSTTVISSTADLTRLNESAPPVTTQLHRVKEYEAGRAEAFTALCTIFSRQECGESVIPTYLARFYHALLVGLQYDPFNYTGEVLTKIILHCTGLLRKDLPGINMLMPYFISALDKVLTSKKPQIYCDVPSNLRHASIQLLVSMLALPLHFVHLPLPDVSLIFHSSMEFVRGHSSYQSAERRASSSSSSLPPTFYSMKNQLVTLLFAAIETEEDHTNMEMLLHGLMVYIQDLVSYERTLTAMTGEYQIGKPDYDATSTDDENADKPFASSFSPTILFQKAISAASGVLLSSANSPTANSPVVLAALELLSGLARLQFDAFSHNECREAVQCVCDFIESQAQQKPYLQTKQLHTSIVAAFQTLLVWILEHPHLLAHEGCLRAILRVAEFGVSGSFSLENDGSTIYKGEKQLKPISGRVGEIAEFVLQNLMEKTGSFPFPCGPASSSSLLTEEEVLKNLQKQGKFQYFLVDNSFILGLLEHPTSVSSNGESSLPTVSTIVRGPSGRQVWSMQLRHHPQDAKPTQSHLKSMARPSVCGDSTSIKLHNWSPWAREASQQTSLKLEDSIPALGEVLDDSFSNLHEEFSILTNQQIEVAQNLNAELQQARAKIAYPDPSTAQEPPEIKKVFNTARLILGHLGLLNVDSLSETQLLSGQASLSLLDSSCSSFRNALVSLDRMPARFCNTVFVFFCQKGVSKVEDIFANQTLSGKPQEFVKFLGSLGWEVDPVKHPGFSGRIHSSMAGEGRPVHLSAQIPLKPFPYYADAMNEVAFVLPVLKPSASDSSSSVRSLESSDSGQESPAVASDPLPPPPISIPTWSSPSGSGVQESSVYAGVGEQEKQTAHSKIGVKGCVTSQFGKSGTYADSTDTPKRRSSVIQDCAAIVVWLEKFEDHLQFPAESLSRMLHKGTGRSIKTGTNILPIVFIHRLASGLYQTVIKAEERGGPLIDGMVVSWRCLGALVRQTTINLCSRHRMNNEGYSPPHVKRKKRIEEIGAAFAKSSTAASLYSELLLDKQ